jgi:hypothetical protein
MKHKICNKCNEDKATTFYNRNVSAADGRKSICKPCEKEGKVRYSKEYYQNRSLLGRYGITLEDYNKMLLLQESRCKICDVHQKHCDKRLAVDHCHTTGEVRGLLCQHCNTGLGQFRDNTAFLKEAINYLEQTQGAT